MTVVTAGPRCLRRRVGSFQRFGNEAALSASIACYAPEPVWWHYPLAWTMGGIGEITLGFALAGLAMARIAR